MLFASPSGCTCCVAFATSVAASVLVALLRKYVYLSVAKLWNSLECLLRRYAGVRALLLSTQLPTLVVCFATDLSKESSKCALFSVLAPGPRPLTDPSLRCSFPSCDGSEGIPETCRSCGASKVHEKCVRDSGLLSPPFPRNCHACILSRLTSGNLTRALRAPGAAPPTPQGTPAGCRLLGGGGVPHQQPTLEEVVQGKILDAPCSGLA